MKIIGYTFEADCHCVSCAQKRFGYSPAAMADALKLPIAAVEFDEHGLPVRQEDNKGNPIHPMFSTDFQLVPQACGDCHERIE